MINIIEIKDLDNKVCSCCRTRDSNRKFYIIKFLHKQSRFTDGIHIKLCENCLEELFDKSIEIVLQGKTIEQS